MLSLRSCMKLFLYEKFIEFYSLLLANTYSLNEGFGSHVCPHSHYFPAIIAL